MKNEVPSDITPSKSTQPKYPTGQELTARLRALQTATSAVHSALRGSLVNERNALMSPPPQAHIRRMQQLEKAHELSRQAESKIELLVLHFGGSI
jgi:hypothetical protein